MKYLSFAVLLFIASACAQNNSNGKVELKTFQDSSSYAIGADIARTFHRQKIDVNDKALTQGFIDFYTAKNQKVTEAEVDKILRKFQMKLQADRQKKNDAQGAINKKKGEEFLKKNKTKKGVKVTPSGLQYKILKKGHGPKPKLTDKVKVNYKGTLIDGTEFDSSYKRGKPAEFPVSGVIKGWTEALQMMPVGSKWELYIPSDLAYGAHAPQSIGPNQTLIFEVELLGIDKPAKNKKLSKKHK